VTAAFPAKMSIFELQEKCLFAVPKKGRLWEKVKPLIENIGLAYIRNPRLDIAVVSNFDNLAIIFLPAADIALYTSLGRVDMGITGEDIVHETEVTMKLKCNVQARLSFGKCRLSVQTPIKDKITDPKDLVGKRIATSFPATTREYFDGLNTEKAGSTIVESLNGSVEVACALGLADGIVDLVETGTTMRAAGLEEIGTVISSEACFITNPQTKFKNVADVLIKRIKGVLEAEKFVMMEYNLERYLLDKAKLITPGKTSPTLSPLDNSGWVAVKVMVPKGDVNNVMDKLTAIGASDIVVSEIINCRT